SAMKLISAFRVSPSAQPLGTNGSELRLGNIEGRVPLTFLLEFTVEPTPAGTELPLIIDLTADIPSESNRNYQLQVRHNLSIVAEEPVGEPSETLLAAVQAWNLHQINKNVWSDIEQGNVQRAKTRMLYLTKRLMEAGHTKLAQQLLTETERLSTGGSVSLDGRKTLTFATRSLVTRTVRLGTTDDETMY
ncbi:MAG TPA: hypothetical protein VLE70_19350, partial [Anaerolineae bacterium]|nr:hypothetical protein [Anaerolineae bacterium]